MKLSLSGRLWEIPNGYRIQLGDQIALARRLGYDGIEIRYPMLPPLEESDVVAAQLRAESVAAVFCSCAAVPHDAASWNDAMRVVRTVHRLGGSSVRLALEHPDGIPAVRELARRAEAFAVRVLLHLHAHTLCDTSHRAMALVHEIDHPNLRLLVDPLHLALAGETDLPAVIARLSPVIGLVNLQNYRRTGPEEKKGELQGSDDFWTRLSPHPVAGLDFRTFLTQLHEAGYAGWLNVMCPTSSGEDPVEVATGYGEVLTSLLDALPGHETLAARR